MKRYAVVNQRNEVEAIYDEHQNARQAAIESKQDVSVTPIMSIEDWSKTHKDFKGSVKGKPYVLYLDSQYGTCYSPVYLIEGWDEWQIRTSDDKRLHKRYSEFVQAPWKPMTPEEEANERDWGNV